LLAAGLVLTSPRAFGQAAADPGLGKSIYNHQCAQCHGENGKGDGPAASMLSPVPRDFTSGAFKIRSTESGSIPTDQDLLTSIQHGLPGSAMPDWAPFLNGDSLKAVLAYVKMFSPRFAKEHPKPVRPRPMVRSTAQSIAAGKRLYAKLQCASCHGSDGTGKDAVATELLDDSGNETRAANLTEPWTFRGGPSPRDIYLRLRTGMNGTPMPSFSSAATETDLMNVANYVASLARKPVWEMNADEIKAFYAREEEEARNNPVGRGRYLVGSLGCAFCHSPVLDDGSVDKTLLFAGGQRMDINPFGTFVSYNLTSDKETGLGSWTDEQIKTFITSGVRRDGTRMLPFPMPWAAYAGLKDDDLNAIIAYLRTIPPIYNKIPPPKSKGLLSYLWQKFEILILKRDVPGVTYPGNAGTPKEKTVSMNESSTKGGRP